MPLKDGSSDEVVSANIAELIRAGHSKEQAAAIAYQKAGRAAKSDDVEAFHVVGKSCKVLVIKGPPTAVELLRGSPFVNDDGLVLQKQILDPLGLKRNEVMLAWCDPTRGGEDLLEQFAKSSKPDVIICMSDETVLLKDKSSWNLPTTAQLRTELTKYVGEMERKRVSIAKRLDATKHRVLHSIQLITKGATPTDAAAIEKPIFKADSSEQVVYGVVLDPYTVDTQRDWAPPREIRKTAHDFLAKSGFVGLHHQEVAHDARTVESFVEDYPPGELDKANLNEPHRVYARKYSNGEVVHSGAWVIGVQLSDRLWKKYENGEIAAFSMEGYGKRIPMTSTLEMPKVTFVDIGEVGSARTGRTNDQTD